MFIEKITNFLENYLGTSGDFEDGLAHMDLDDDAGPAARFRGHKYMSQLVRSVVQSCEIITDWFDIATDCEP